MILRTAASMLTAALLSAPAPAETLAWWRFEDRPVGSKLVADSGDAAAPVATTASHAQPRNQLRTFNTRPDRYPPDTSGTFFEDPILPGVAGTDNRQCVRFIGNQDFYTSPIDGVAPPIDGAPLARFTIEGLFQLEALSGEINNRYQTILGKDGRPVAGLPFQPFVAVVAGQDDAFMSRDCLSVNLIDRSGRYRSAASRRPLEKEKWYAFAAVCDGRSLSLWINRFDGKGYCREAETDVSGGLYESTATWTVGRGMFDGAPNSWLQGMTDEIRISDAILDPQQWLAPQATLRADRAAASTVHRGSTAPDSTTQPTTRPALCVRGLADPAVLVHDGTYYLYGTTDTNGFDVWTSRDLREWTKGPRLLERGAGVWGDSHFWAPGVLEYRGKFYLFYSASGALPRTGGRRGTRICIAVADAPTGPFREIAAPLPLIGSAVIDPEPFLAPDGTPYLYFVEDISEHHAVGQVLVAKLRDDLTGIAEEPIPCFSPNQPWEGGTWNEGPAILQTKNGYVLMYSAQFWGSPAYGVGFATAPSPTGPWDKDDFNPVLQHYAGLNGTGHNCVVRDPDGAGWLVFFHAHRSPTDTTRDTYVARLIVEPGKNGRETLRVEPLVR